MRAIGYSLLDPSHEGSIQQEKDAFFHYCREQGHQPVDFFAEPGVIEAHPDVQYQRMLEYMRTSVSEFLVVIPDSGHLGPDLEGVTKRVLDLDSLGAKVVCTDDDFPDPLQNALNRIGPSGVSLGRSQRIKEAMSDKALRGEALGRPPYGYRIGTKGNLEVVPEEASIIELIFSLYARDGLGLRRIAQQLNQQSIPTRRGHLWNMVSVRGILQNRAYVGTYTRFGLRIPGSHPPIVPQEVFGAVQARFRERNPRRKERQREPFLLSGTLYCGHCGSRMMGVTRHQRWRRKDGQGVQRTYRYYQCQARNNQSLCQYHTQRAFLLEEKALDSLSRILETRPAPDEPDAGVEGSPSSDHTLVKNAQRRFLRAFKRAAMGAISVNQLGKFLTPLEKARVRNEAISQGNAIEELKAPLRDTQAWENLDIADKKALLSEAHVRIVVTENGLEVSV